MEKDSKFLRDADGYIAVRVLPQTEALPATEKDSMFGRDVNGNIGVRVIGVGGGGGDTHNKGYYATPEDLQEALPTAEAGDYAIVGSTDTVWVWDTSTSAWVDTDTKGEVSPDMVIIKSLTMPAASTTPAGAVYQYIGTTNSNYTHGYIYENVKSATYTGTVSFEPATLSSTTVACSGDDFATFLTEAGADPTPIVSGTMTYEADATGWRLVGKDSNNNVITTFLEYQEDYEDFGFVFTGTPQDGDVIAFTCTIEEDTISYTWTRLDVQPAPVIPDPLPSQTGNAGKFLTTNGSTASWGAALANQTTASRSILVGEQASGTGTDNTGFGFNTNVGSNSCNTAIGSYSQAANGSTAMGYQAKATGVDSIACGYYTQAQGNYSISVGDRATAKGTSIAGGRNAQSEDRCVSLGAYAYSRYDSIAIGNGSSTSYRAEADYYGLAIGNNAKATNNNIAIGESTQAGAYGIVIGGATKGYKGGAHSILMVAGANSYNISATGASPVGSIILDAIDNKNSSTPYSGCSQDSFYVGLASTLWKILDGTTGLFSPNRIASTTGLADGTYVLKMTIVDGVKTLSWVFES